MNDEEKLQALYNLWITDEAFRTEIRNSPREALQQRLGLEIADDVSVILHIPTSLKEVHLVMPYMSQQPMAIDSELINDGGVSIACTTSVPGGTCWNTPNCPTLSTCAGGPC